MTYVDLLVNLLRPAGQAPLPDPWVEPIRQAATQHGLEPSLYASLLFQESSLRPDAFGPPNGMGLAQLEPLARRWTGIQNPYDPYQSILAGAQWAQQLARELGGSPPVEALLAAYNAGSPAVTRALQQGRPLTQVTAHPDYIPSILRNQAYYEPWFAAPAPAPVAPERTVWPVLPRPQPFEDTRGRPLLGELGGF